MYWDLNPGAKDRLICDSKYVKAPEKKAINCN